MSLDDKGLGETEDDRIVSATGETSPLQAEYLKELEGVVTPAYVRVVKKSFPWLSGLTLNRDDDTKEWFAIFERDGQREAVPLAGPTFPQFPDDFIKCVQKHLAVQVDRSKMDGVKSQLAEWATDDEGDDE